LSKSAFQLLQTLTATISLHRFHTTDYTNSDNVNYEKCQHALCGAHLLRELTYFAEFDEQRKVWAEALRQLLLEIKREVDGVKENGGH